MSNISTEIRVLSHTSKIEINFKSSDKARRYCEDYRREARVCGDRSCRVSSPTPDLALYYLASPEGFIIVFRERHKERAREWQRIASSKRLKVHFLIRARDSDSPEDEGVLDGQVQIGRTRNRREDARGKISRAQGEGEVALRRRDTNRYSPTDEVLIDRLRTERLSNRRKEGVRVQEKHTQGRGELDLRRRRDTNKNRRLNGRELDVNTRVKSGRENLPKRAIRVGIDETAQVGGDRLRNRRNSGVDHDQTEREPRAVANYDDDLSEVRVRAFNVSIAN